MFRCSMNELRTLDKESLQELTNIAEQKQRLECDGLTRVASYILNAKRIDHRTDGRKPLSTRQQAGCRIALLD